jgi:hypothetical protein
MTGSYFEDRHGVLIAVVDYLEHMIERFFRENLSFAKGFCVEEGFVHVQYQ